jgi:hypothetical protein
MKRLSRRPADGDTTVKRILGLVAGCSLVMAALAVVASPVRAQTTRQVTLTFKLTINGTPPRADGFAAQWGETGVELCSAPCSGSGHTFVRTMTFPAGATETFVFIRSSGRVTPDHPGQMFGKQTLSVEKDHTVSAFFTYSAAAIATPSTGSAPPVALGSAITGAGAALVLLSIWRPRRMRTAALGRIAVTVRAGKGNRTLTPLRAQRPERCVSTSSTTPASDGGHRS